LRRYTTKRSVGSEYRWYGVLLSMPRGGLDEEGRVEARSG